MKILSIARFITACLFLLQFLASAAIAQNNTIEFTVDGLKVILRQTQKETLVMSMYFRGGTSNYSAEKAGIESLALTGAVQCGTAKYSPSEVDEFIDEFGLHIGGSARNDYGVIKLSCITRYSNEAWKLFSSSITSPIFDAQKFALLKEQKINVLKAESSNPDYRLRNLAQSFAFANTSYAINPEGTEDVLPGLTASETKDYYYRTLLNKRRMFLVVAGNITKEELEKKVAEDFKTIEAKPLSLTKPENSLFDKEDSKIEERQIATNYIAGIISAPLLSSPDYPAFRIGTILLNSGLFDYIRLSKHLSYAPSASMSEGLISYVTMYASTTQPEKTIDAMRMILGYTKDVIYSEKMINNIRKSVTDSYMKNQEIMSDIVDNLGEAEIAGDWKLAENLPARMIDVTPEEVRKVMRIYGKKIKWVYIGNPEQIQGTF